jgi:hypothetical protein
VLERLRARAAEGERQRAVRSASWLESLLEWARGLARPAVLRHGIAALQRGNLDAAFALLREEVTARPDRAESALLFWEVALSCQRPRDAAEPMARLFQREVLDGQLDTATDHWIALVAQVPEARAEVSALVRILPILRARLAATRGEVAHRQARERLCDALRRSVDPAAGSLPPALALRIVDEARGIDLDVATRAAQAALASPGLHEAKRGKLEELLRALERGEWPEAPAAPVAARPAPAPRPTAAPRAAAGPRPAAAPRPAAPAAPAVPPRAAAPPRPAASPAPRSAVPGPASSARPAPARPAPARPEAARSAPAASSPPRAVAASHPLAEPPAAAGAVGRRSVALSQNEIEAASMRLAERMAARAAAASPAEAPAAPPSAAPAPKAAPPAKRPKRITTPAARPEPAPEPAAEVLAEPRFLSDLEAEAAFASSLEVDAAPLSPESVELSVEDADLPIADAELSLDDDDVPLEVGDGAVALEDDETSASAHESGLEVEFEFGAAAEAESTPSAAGTAPEPARSGGALRAIEITPVELTDDGLLAWEVAQAQRTRVDYRAVEFLVAAEVEGQGEAPVFLVDLVLRARPGRPRSALRMRTDTFDAASLYPDRSDAGQALRALLSDLLERTHAIPLPDPDSALGVRPQRFESLAAFEAAILARLSG